MDNATWDAALIITLTVMAVLALAVWARDAWRYYRDNRPKRGATYISRPPVKDSRSSMEYSKPHMPNNKRYG